MKKVITAGPILFAFALFGCAQHAATAPAAARPSDTAGNNDLNTFGDSKEEAAGNAAHARSQNFSSDPSSSGSTAENPSSK
jgi:hypothetical protein